MERPVAVAMRASATPAVMAVGWLAPVLPMMRNELTMPMTGMKVNLPKAASGEKSNAARVMLTMDAAGTIYLNRQVVRLEEVTARLRERIAANPEAQVIVNADRTLRHGQVVALMDAARRANPKVMAVATEPNPEIR